MTENTPEGGKRFTDFPLAPDVQEALARLGIVEPTPIQEACIPAVLEGKDVVGKAETGTGKTFAFAAPLIGRVDTKRVAAQVLVLAPTRELAQQVAGVFEQVGAGRKLGVALVVGGVHASEQVLQLRSGSQVVVGTPGRVLEFLQDRTLSLVWCETVVLDEADRMLDMGFIDDVTAILEKIPAERQTLLFSATIPPEIKKLLHRFMKHPVMFSTSLGLSTVEEIKQYYCEAAFPAKFRALRRILDAHRGGTVLIFCNTRRQAIDLDRMLWGNGYPAGALHGDHEQEVRFKTLEAFRKGDIKILVATDVASRGLDVEDIACVVNYEIPSEPESYVHRIGRTGRAQKTGEAISIVSRKEWDRWQRILRQTGFKVERWRSEGREERGHGGGRPARTHTQAPPRIPATEPPQAELARPEGVQEEVEAAPLTPEALGNWQERPKVTKPQRIKIEEINDDFLKHDYFDVDHEAVARAEEVGGGHGGRGEGREKRRRDRGRGRGRGRGHAEGEGHGHGQGHGHGHDEHREKSHAQNGQHGQHVHGPAHGHGQDQGHGQGQSHAHGHHEGAGAGSPSGQERRHGRRRRRRRHGGAAPQKN